MANRPQVRRAGVSTATVPYVVNNGRHATSPEARARVLRAWNGVEALELIRTVLPAAVVLDIKLPRLDGWQVLAELKADPATAAIPVVIASVVDDRPRGLALGADVYLRKPVRRDELLDALRRVGAMEGAES